MRQMNIRVGIMAEEAIHFQFVGQYTSSANSLCTYADSELTCKLIDGKLHFDGHEYDELTFTPADYNTCSFILHDVTIGIDFHWQRQENQQFRGALTLIVENNKVRAINTLFIEDYLESVISSEMSATSSIELLKAHAVISRSWVLQPILDPVANVSEGVKLNYTDSGKLTKWYERDAHTNFHVCADDHCQRYQGITRAGTQAVHEALSDTRGEVLIYDEKICDARFSKSCGGASEEFENCWADTHYPYLKAIADNKENAISTLPDLTIETNANEWIRTQPSSFCNTNDKQILQQVLNNYDQETNDFYRWQVHYTQKELSELVQKRSGIDFGLITDLIPIKRGKSGRLIELKIIGTKRSLTVGKELEIRKWLSESHLYSSAFVVDKDSNNDFILIGAGWGHGVGLCQIGSAVMSAKGYKYKDILMHYFGGAEIRKIY